MNRDGETILWYLRTSVEEMKWSSCALLTNFECIDALALGKLWLCLTEWHLLRYLQAQLHTWGPEDVCPRSFVSLALAQDMHKQSCSDRQILSAFSSGLNSKTTVD